MAYPLRFGIKINQSHHAIDAHRDAWLMADDAGFDHIWGYDHLFALGPDPTQPIFDGWTFLGAMAQATKRARIGLNVTGNLYRHPGLLAKVAVTVDHLSNGRLEFGIGAAWNDPEFAQHGLAFPSAADRIRMLNESVRAMKLLWAEPRATFEGRFYRFSEAIAEPKPVQKPHPPIVIGGRGPKATTRIAARHAQGWNTSGSRGFDADAEAMRILDAHCATIGRDPKTLRRSVNLGWQGGKGLELAKRYRDVGFTEFVIAIGNDGADALRDVDELQRDALPKLRALA